jgi:hypothetical protein
MHDRDDDDERQREQIAAEQTRRALQRFAHRKRLAQWFERWQQGRAMNAPKVQA